MQAPDNKAAPGSRASEDRAAPVWTNEGADTLFVGERERKTGDCQRDCASDHKLGSVLAEIRLPDVLIDEQRLAGVLQHDLANFQDVAIVGQRKRRGSVLLNEQDGHTF
jgi:hypothetical protein